MTSPRTTVQGSTGCLGVPEIKFTREPQAGESELPVAVEAMFKLVSTFSRILPEMSVPNSQLPNDDHWFSTVISTDHSFSTDSLLCILYISIFILYNLQIMYIHHILHIQDKTNPLEIFFSFFAFIAWFLIPRPSC